MAWHRTTIAAHASGASAVVPVNVAGRALVLVAWDATWFALEDRCSHAGCAFSEDGVAEEGRLVCECHGSEFDLATGAVRRPPATVRIETFEVRVVDAELEVRLP